MNVNLINLIKWFLFSKEEEILKDMKIFTYD